LKLTVKDKDFLEKLKKLLEEKDLKIDLKEDGFKRFVLRENYGDKIEGTFSMTRQGIRWRSHRLFNEIYVSAYETIYFIESNFGPSLRALALQIVKERVEMRKKAKNMLFFDASRREGASSEPVGAPGQL